MKTVLQNLTNIPIFILLVFLQVSFNTNAQVGIGTTDPKSTFEVNGTFGQKVNTITTATTLDDTYGSVIICNNGSTAITVTLPTVSSCTGRVYIIKRNATSAANVTIAGTIDGVTNLILKDANDSATLFSNGTEWKAASNSNSSWNMKGNSGTSSTTNYLGTSDATDFVLKTNATSRVNITSAGVTKIGDGTNDTKIDSDGSLSLEGTATAFNDIVVPLFNSRLGTNNQAIWVKMKDNGAGSRGVYTFTFEGQSSSINEQEVFFSVQLPHNWKEGSIIYPHIHWSPQDNSNGTVVWGLEYTWINYVSASPIAFPNTTIINVTTSSITGSADVDKHLITSFASITPSANQNKISSVLMCRFYRKSADAADTYNGNAAVLSLDFHYEIDAVGSHTQFAK